jgi:hypothetical protein
MSPNDSPASSRQPRRRGHLRESLTGRGRALVHESTDRRNRDFRRGCNTPAPRKVQLRCHHPRGAPPVSGRLRRSVRRSRGSYGSISYSRIWCGDCSRPVPVLGESRRRAGPCCVRPSRDSAGSWPYSRAGRGNSRGSLHCKTGASGCRWARFPARDGGQHPDSGDLVRGINRERRARVCCGDGGVGHDYGGLIEGVRIPSRAHSGGAAPSALGRATDHSGSSDDSLHGPPLTSSILWLSSRSNLQQREFRERRARARSTARSARDFTLRAARGSTAIPVGAPWSFRGRTT